MNDRTHEQQADDSKQERIIDVVRDICDQAECYHDAWLNDPVEFCDNEIIVHKLCSIANRIEAAEIREQAKRERERREYEKLHDCFWAKDAIQNIIRQMLGARDDLRRVDPRESDDLEYFAHGLMKAAKKRDATPGNTAALREACKTVRDLLMLRGDGKTQCVLTWDEFNESQKMLHAALAAPPRNCDQTINEAVHARNDFCTTVDCADCPYYRDRSGYDCGWAWLFDAMKPKGGKKQ